MAIGVRTRIAPSPTGDPHVGTAYVALFNYALARQARRPVHPAHRGHRPRAQLDPAAEAMIFDALRWLGLALGRGPRRRRTVRALPPERALGDLPRATPSSWSSAAAPTRCFCTRGAARGAARGAEGAAKAARARLRRPLPDAPARPRPRQRARERRAARHPPGDAARQASRVVARPAARRGALRQRADRRPGAAQERRLPDLPPRQRGRRPPDGDHAT